MKKNILVICMLTLLCFLSCDINALNELLGKAREKFLEENNKVENLKSIEEDQKVKEKQVGILKKTEEGVRQVVQAASVNEVPIAPVNEVLESSVVRVNGIPEMPVLQQEKIEIKDKNLTPDTKEEKEAEEAIKEVENALQNSSFLLLIEEAHKLKDKYGQINVSVQDLYEKVQYEKELLGTNFRNQSEKRRALIRLQNQLKVEFSNLDVIMTRIDIAINNIKSAKSLFEKAKETLNESIIRRLQRVTNRYLIREYELTVLSMDARRYAKNSLEQALSSSIKINEGKADLQRIKEFVEEAKSALASFKK